MKEAINLAKLAYDVGEVPVGAVIYDKDESKIIARCYNLVEKNNNPTCHAELLAINEACKYKSNKFLTNCDIYVSLEPCPMCAQAISNVKINRLYFAAFDKKSGGVDHGAKIFNASSCHHKPQIYGGLLEADSQKLLTDFFQDLRHK